MIRWLVLGVAIAGATSAPAWADADLFSGDQLRGFLDFRAGASDGEHSFLDGGFGKTRFGGGDDGWKGHAAIDGALIWRPRLTWSLSGYLDLRADPEQDHMVDAVEAYLNYKPMPIGGVHLSARAGLFYPPVSLEHDGLGWSTTETITPSAINTWIGEEVKVIGVEGAARRAFGDQELSATLAAFGYNDTSGTVLAYRGWAMHDVLNTAFGDLPLPEQGPAWYAIKSSQADSTRPVDELDHRVGFYGRIEWRPTGALRLNAFHYDNAGDRVSVSAGQWSWETRFTNLGLSAKLGDNTRLLAQAMTGQTILGMRTPMGYWVDVDFGAAYLLVAHDVSDTQAYAARLDYFETDDQSFPTVDNNNEEGWAATFDYRVALTPQATLMLEGLHIESDRPQRASIGEDREQKQTTLQSTLRLSF